MRRHSAYHVLFQADSRTENIEFFRLIIMNILLSNPECRDFHNMGIKIILFRHASLLIVHNSTNKINCRKTTALRYRFSPSNEASQLPPTSFMLCLSSTSLNLSLVQAMLMLSRIAFFTLSPENRVADLSSGQSLRITLLDDMGGQTIITY